MRTKFIQWCKFVRCHSEATCTEYNKMIALFESYLEAHSLSLQSFTETEVNDWIISQTSVGVKCVTVNTRVTCLRTFYDYLCRFQGFPTNPFVGVKKLKVPKVLPKYIERATIDKALAAISGTSFLNVRARVSVAFLYMTGLRRAEFANLRMIDVNRVGHVVRVFGKGRKERLCPIPLALDSYLDEWERARATFVQVPSEYYFCGTDGNMISDTAIARIIHRVFDAWVPKSFAHPHILRHSYATTLMQSGLPIVDISRLLGHTDTHTTLRYLSLSPSSQYSAQLNSIF